MGIISWVILGLIAGALAKWLMPGKDGGGIFITMLLGIAGALVGGYIGEFLGIGNSGGLSLSNILTATAGAFLILFAYRLVKQSGGESAKESSGEE
ncbi:MAG: GlsB/YeaQ/YmgE family stress response membrane protein [Candidatus Thiodiazotropha sp. (ex. Lucinisca nassula)]|nr:GlsB/YeaQ/YmgE family stress response membrane protein [Candidatus Thiodiazotropha sp. (ex. Lucinisca nassula)]MBW9263373.1 GlsB/YeaQ/YmgE family stress response membrane protein [Candidatus Thiodiazotropha sp. (ex. Lucinisca nassula)]